MVEYCQPHAILILCVKAVLRLNWGKKLLECEWLPKYVIPSTALEIYREPINILLKARAERGWRCGTCS